MSYSSRIGSCSVLLLVAACDSGGGSAPTGGSTTATPSRVLVTASTVVLEPTSVSTPTIDATLLDGAPVAAAYRLTTPADTMFSFDIVAWQDAAAGATDLSIAHARSGDAPAVGTNSLLQAGILATGSDLGQSGNWTTAHGDGTARITLQGRIATDQVVAVDTPDGDPILVEIAIGPRSVINRPESGGAGEGGGSGGSGGGGGGSTETLQTIFSSNSMMFGLPTVAVSGDRTSVVCYQGAGVATEQRHELRLQHDRATGAVTTGGIEETTLDTGNWRDHEIAAKDNVIALVRSEPGAVVVQFSFDRGATFGQTMSMPIGGGQARLVQIAMANDHRVAVGFWRATSAGLDMCLLEASPLERDGNGSPTWYQFAPVQVLRALPANGIPTTTGIAWSEGRDLVIGYGATWTTPPTGTIPPTTTTETTYRCATRLEGGSMQDVIVDRQAQVFAMDPSVAVLGKGSSLRIFYAFEAASGVQLASSNDAGATFTLGPVVGAMGDHLPSVFARDVNGATRVDVLYLGTRSGGLELHHTSWADWSSPVRTVRSLNAAQYHMTPPRPEAPMGEVAFTELGRLGYDAVADGNAIVVVYDEVSMLLPVWAPAGGSLAVTAANSPAAPPLYPGMTEPAPAVEASHRHQLRLLRMP